MSNEMLLIFQYRAVQKCVIRVGCACGAGPLGLGADVLRGRHWYDLLRCLCRLIDHDKHDELMKV